MIWYNIVICAMIILNKYQKIVCYCEIKYIENHYNKSFMEDIMIDNKEGSTKNRENSNVKPKVLELSLKEKSC